MDPPAPNIFLMPIDHQMYIDPFTAPELSQTLKNLETQVDQKSVR